MKKLLSCSVLIMLATVAYSQLIRGTVYDSETKLPLPNAAVYFTGTLVGTSSDEDGKFELDITKYAARPLTIRAIGYQTFILNSLLENNQYRIYLSPDLFEIEEVAVETKNLEKKRKAYLKLFRREFLGTSGNRRLCEILNEEDITFNYGLDKDTVKAYARKPINIYNGALGYVITYHLDMFEYDKDRNVVSFSGDIVFNEDLAVGQSNDGSYSGKREDAYLGSCMHLIRSLWNNSLKKSGFTISRYTYDVLASGVSLSSMPNVNVSYDDIVVLDMQQNKYLNNAKELSLYYGSRYSKMYFLKSNVLIGKNGFYDPSGIRWYGHMASQRIGDMLPYDYILFRLSTLESIGQISGTVRDADQQPLPHVHIINKRAVLGTQSDGGGRYSITADSGDTLLFTFVGMQPVEHLVEKSPSVIDVGMQEMAIELEEVEISERYESSHKTQKELLAEYPENKKLIKTSMGILDRDLSSTAFRIIDGNDMVPGGRDFLNSLEGHVPQMKVIRDCEKCPHCDCVYLRSFTGSGKTALFDVDGFLTPSPPTYLNAGDIDRVAILERNAAIMRYGPQGAVGVIVINTKARTELDDMGVIRSYDNRELVKSLKSSVSYLDPYHPDAPLYVSELNEARNRKEALDIYEIRKMNYFGDPYYFLDMYDYFLSRWGNSKKSEELFQDVRNHVPDNVPELKALAYLQQQYGNFESASDLYLQILMMQSWDAQSLRDVANAFAEAGDIKKAWMYYIQYINIQSQLPDSHFDAYGEDLLITTEMMDILDRNKEPFLDNHDLDSILNDDMRTRLVFEWNNQETEFDLQFVTPEGYYDTWEHKPGMDDWQNPEVAKGYCSKQFFLGKENRGLWQVNIDYKGNSSEHPSYLKVSVYRNYGLANQELEIKVYKLSEMPEMVQLFTIDQS